MLTQRSIWITLLFSILGSCKSSSSNPNRVIGGFILATCKDQKISKEECEKQKQKCLEAREVQGVCWDEKHQICLPFELSDCHKPNRMMQNSNHEPFIGSGKEVRWPPKIGGRDSLPLARASFKNRVGPAGIDWSNPKDVGVKPSGQNPPKNKNRLGYKDTNDYMEKTNRDTNPDPDQCLDCPEDPKPALPKEVTELQNRVGNLEKRVGDLEKVNVTSSTSSSTTLENVHPR